jgi:hypothetical protein
MEKNDFVDFLKENSDTFEWAEGKHENKPGIYVKNHQFDTETHFTNNAIENNELQVLIEQTNQGKNVEQITRVTGFFSKVHSWNKGKLGELKQRHRVDDVDRNE